MNSRPSSSAGFTLTELIVVIVIASILAAISYSRIKASDFTVQGSTDELKSAVRYAQKLAIAQRRNVYVSASGTDLRLCYDNGCASHVSKPPTTDWFKLTAPDTASLSSAFYFDSQGRPTLTSGSLATSTITLQITGALSGRIISVEPQTGFVHST